MKQYGIIFLLAVAILAMASVFTVDQREYAVVFQFGEAVRTVKDPGLNFNIPLIQNVEVFEKRVLHVDAETKELTASDGKRVIVDAFAKFRISDPVQFYKTVRNYNGVKLRLNRILESSMRKVIGTVPLTSVVSGGREEIMHNIYTYVNEEAKAFGVDIIDVRLLRADLPKENSNAIYLRMQTDREKEAKQIRAEGQEEYARIVSKADKESQIIIAEARMRSQEIRGEGDNKAAKIYNNAFGADPEFYEFYRHIAMYDRGMTRDTVLLLSPDSDALQYLNLNGSRSTK